MAKRAGWKTQRTTYRLKFEGDLYDGLEVDAKSIPLGATMEMEDLQQKASDDTDAAKDILRKLAGVIVGWNIEDDDDQPVATTYEGLLTLELPLVMAIFKAWREAVAGVPNRSSTGSNDGGTSLEQSIQMDLP